MKRQNEKIWIKVNAIFVPKIESKALSIGFTKDNDKKNKKDKKQKYNTGPQYIDLSEICSVNETDDIQCSALGYRGQGNRWTIKHRTEELLKIMKRYNFIHEIVDLT